MLEWKEGAKMGNKTIFKMETPSLPEVPDKVNIYKTIKSSEELEIYLKYKIKESNLQKKIRKCKLNPWPGLLI